MPLSQLLCVGLFLILTTFSCDAAENTKKPHVILMLADGLGSNDIGYLNPAVKSPNVDELAVTGLILNNTYGSPSSSESSIGLLTGRYPYKDGLQHMDLQLPHKICAPLDLAMLPRTMKSLNYSTHMLGEWHMGFCSEICWPTNRGFDSYLGIIEGSGDIYKPWSEGKYDFFNGTVFLKEKDGSLISRSYAERSLEILEKHDPSDPLFLYYAFSLPGTPIKVPKQYEDLYPDIENNVRRKYLGMVSMMDEAVGNVMKMLKEKGMYDDSIIIWMSDNGGDPGIGGNNYPLRGGKNSIFEGGARVPALISGGYITPKETETEALFHISDLFPTLLSALGEEDIVDQDFDGISQWDMITNGGEGPRKGLVYNLDIHTDTFDPLAGYAAIRDDTYKLIWGYPGKEEGWQKPGEVCQELEVKDRECNLVNKSIVYDDAYMEDLKHHYQEQKAAGIDDQFLLFNLITDPNERYDLSKDLPEKVAELKTRLLEEIENVAYPLFGGIYFPNGPPIVDEWGSIRFSICTSDWLIKIREYSLENKGWPKVPEKEYPIENDDDNKYVHEDEYNHDDNEISSGSRVMINKFLGLVLVLLLLTSIC